jgi:hypothetical protein
MVFSLDIVYSPSRYGRDHEELLCELKLDVADELDVPDEEEEVADDEELELELECSLNELLVTLLVLDGLEVLELDEL